MTAPARVALVTGAGRGIGPEIARVLAQKGMAVAVNARSESAEATAERLRRNMPCDSQNTTHVMPEAMTYDR